MYLRIRNLCGFLGMVLPWIALLSAGLTPHESAEWWWSISATYYQTPALVGILVPACLVLLTYISYSKLDNIITSLSGIFGLGIVLFPCKVSWIADGTPVGFFQVPIEVSNIVHGVCAMIFFMLLAYNCIFLFTKTNAANNPTKRKKLRNKIYRVCGYGMLAFELVFAVVKFVGGPGFCTMIVEIILLSLFGISWLVKGEAFPFLNDVEEDSLQNQN